MRDEYDFSKGKRGAVKRKQESSHPGEFSLNGSPAVMMATPEKFDRWAEHQRFLDAVSTGTDVLVAGRLLSDGEVKAQLDAEFGALDG